EHGAAGLRTVARLESGSCSQFPSQHRVGSFPAGCLANDILRKLEDIGVHRMGQLNFEPHWSAEFTGINRIEQEVTEKTEMQNRQAATAGFLIPLCFLLFHF